MADTATKVAVGYRIFSFLIAAGLAAYFIWLYATHHDKPCKYNITVYLIVTGVVNLAVSIIEIVFSLLLEQEKIPAARKALFPVFMFAFAWFIVGNVWVFKSKDACDHLVYDTGFWFLITTYIIIGAALIIGCCAGICIMVIKK